MLRAAEAVAEEIGASAIVTGDSVGQVSSQTLPNLAVVSRATPLAVLRPLVGFDKSEIMDRARAIGTYELSKAVGEYCALVPSKPATQARLDAVLAEEARLPERPAARRARRAHRVRPARARARGRSTTRGSRSSALPADAVLLDLRPIEQYRGAHHPSRAPPRLRERARRVAELRPRAALRAGRASTACSRRSSPTTCGATGFRVHHFRGGQRALMRAGLDA